VGWIYCVATVLVGVGFYWLRERRRLLYGGFEILAALLLIYSAFFPHGPNALLVTGPTLWDTLLTRTVNIFAGVYALVRGLDNIITARRARSSNV
jgi:hypothetical protein